MSITRVLFPDPETPVTQVNNPSGTFTSIFFKLFALAPLRVKKSFAVLLFSGISIDKFPERYFPVSELFFPIIFFSFPATTNSPPFSPAPSP